MKKFLLALFLFGISMHSVNAWEAKPDVFYNPMTRNEKAVNRLLKSQVKYANNSNFKKFISTYDKDYINSDGLNLQAYSQMVRDIWVSYDNIKYIMDIKSIKLEDNIATVRAVETAHAYLPLNHSFDGELKSFSESEYILRCKNGKWKIISDKAIDETTSILYGEAKNLDIKLSVPNAIKANTEYCATLEFKSPEQVIAIASIASDIVEFPQKPVEEVFRAMPDDNILERLFTANNLKANEYVVASIGLTKADISNISINLSLVGFGYVMRRVNVIPEKEDVLNAEKI